MKLTLQLRLYLYGAAAGTYLLALVVLTAFVALPSLRRVDHSLAPLEEVFRAIDARQRELLSRIGATERLLATGTPGAPRAVGLAPAQRLTRAPPSLLPRYGRDLSASAAQRLAVAEDALADLESGLSEVLALYEMGDLRAARARLVDIREINDGARQQYHEAMVEALKTGLDAREAFRATTRTLAWIAGGWILGGGLLFLVVVWDSGRHIRRPVAALVDGVRRIADGDWSRPVDLPQRDELGDLARQFNALTDALQHRAGQHAQLATAGELLAGVAHELNNPLQAIRGVAEFRAGGDAGGDWATVLVEARRASKLARELVQFVRPAERHMRLLSLHEVVRAALGLIGFQFRADGIRIELDLAADLPGVRADAHELIQVLVNLLGNAHHVLRRADGERRVTLSTWAADGRVWCRVRDSGSGVAEQDRARVFSPFFSGRAVGAGLGLTVSRAMVRRVGGQLELDAGPGGASFTFWLPATTAPAPPPAAASPPAGVAASLGDATIIVVDDESAIRSVLARFLSREGARVIIASGGREALAKLRETRPDAVVLDVRMPDLDGTRVYQTLCVEQPDIARRTVFLSGDAGAVEAELAMPPGRVLVKPIELSELKRVLVDLIGSTQPSTPR